MKQEMFDNAVKRLNKSYGFDRYKVEQRNNYYAIDLHDENGGCYDNFDAGLTRGLCYNIIVNMYCAVEDFHNLQKKGRIIP